MMVPEISEPDLSGVLSADLLRNAVILAKSRVLKRLREEAGDLLE